MQIAKQMAKDAASKLAPAAAQDKTSPSSIVDEELGAPDADAPAPRRVATELAWTVGAYVVDSVATMPWQPTPLQLPIAAVQKVPLPAAGLQRATSDQSTPGPHVAFWVEPTPVNAAPGEPQELLRLSSLRSCGV
eukprot:gnl/TRDRNA2_/TRDRNA2_182007_c0_seq1.p1 gnl/TRDRNA2_/TRDRNA2_182007_c0~~gnl/TRDRNA2_/TRDRNA2_182007_c0_seq1.p1  ORF type:complete len:135 (-),score=33.29 gnl/TRDRNA2_/TRDRNA2_182007_c0_seq1:163-567(-)